MASVCAIYLWTLGATILLTMLVQYIRGTHDLLSFRNLFLLGFVLHQCHSPADTLFNNNWWMFRVENKDQVGLECAILTTIFVIVFALSYRWGIFAKGAATKFKFPSFDTSPGQLLWFAAVMMGIAAVLRSAMYVLPFVLGILSYRTAVGLCAVSCGLVGWALGRRMNPAFLLYGGGTILVNLAIASLGFSRRPLVAVFAALLWGYYYSCWRYQRPSRVMAKLVGMSIVPILVVATFSSVRESVKGADRSVANIVSRMLTKGDPLLGLQMLTSGDAVGPSELWVMENFPERHPYRHFFTLRFFFMLNIPRSIWPDKPATLGNDLAALARIEGLDLKSHSYALGVVGYAASEGGAHVVIVYGFILAILMKVFDQIIRNHVLNPFLVVPMAADMGQLLGLARGDCALFAHTLITAILIAGLITLVVALSIARRGIPRPPKSFVDWGLPQFADRPRQTVTVWVPAEWAARQRGRA